MARSFAFRPSARLQRYLGTELIGDPNVAIIEFLKNSYDAGASQVLVHFSLVSEPTQLLIADDGVGMDESSFEENWMHPGFSYKAEGAPAEKRRTDSPAERRRAAREPVGEKGLGRLAAGRLGERLEVFTRQSTRDGWLHVDFVWKKFDEMTVPLDRVRVPFDYDTDPPGEVPFGTGTIIVIEGLTQRWDQRVRGRAVRGRRNTRLGRLKQDLEFLVRPLTPTQSDFRISLASDVVLDREDVGEITPLAAVEEAHYSYSFEFSSDKAGRPVIARTVTRSAEAASTAKRARRDSPESVAVTPRVARDEGRPEQLLCGPFKGTFLYNPPPAARRAREIEKSPVGVLLYRNGLLVEPYGMEENDWVGVRARKAQRHGHAAIQPDTFSGFVLITRRGNPKLRDMSNRLGLLETPESENFFEHVRAEFMRFEDILNLEIVAPRVEGSRAEEAQSKAEESQRLATIMLRSLAHSLRQPLQGLGWELVTLEALEGRDDIPEDVRDTLRSVRQSVAAHIERVEARVRDFLNFRTPEFAEIAPADLVKEAMGQLGEVARSRQAKIEVIGTLPATDVLVPADIVVQALANLIQNGLEADRPQDRRAIVQIQGALEDGDVLIEISDNGSGIQQFVPGVALREIVSTKGRPAIGMANAEVAITAARGELKLVRTDGSGTTFEVRLPTRVAGLKG